MITLTDTATGKVAELIEAEGNPALFLRVAVRPGGCSGFTPYPQVVTPDTVSGKPMKVAYVAVYNKK